MKLFTLLRGLVLACVVLTFNTHSVFAAAGGKLTYKDYAALPDFDMFTISPNGEMFAYRNNSSGKQAGIVYSRKEGKIIRVFDMGDVNVYDFEFLTDNFLVMYVSEYQRIPGRQIRREYTNALAYDIAKNKVTQLLRLGDNISEYQSKLGRIIAVSEDQKYVYMPAYIGGNLDEPENGVVRVKLTSPKNPKIVFQGYNDSRDFYLNRHDEVVIHEILFDRSEKYEIRGKSGGKWDTIFQLETEWRPVDVIGITQDEKAAVVIESSSSSPIDTYNEISLADGVKKRLKLSREDVGVQGVIRDSRSHVIGVAYEGFHRDYYFFDREFNERVQSILSMFDGNSVIITDITDDLSHLIVRVEGSNYAGDYFLFSKGMKGQFISTSRNRIKENDINPISKINLKARDGMTIPTLVVIPRTRVASLKNLPAVVLPHGGPEHNDRIGFNWVAQALANEGYLVIQPQFRGSTGFGRTHAVAGYGEWGRKSQNDIDDALQGLVSKGYVDPSRTCVMGSSYGGYAALAAGAFSSNQYKCVVSINGWSDLVRFMNRGLQDTEYKAYWREQISGAKKTTTAFLKEISPYYHADNFSAPVLLFHSTNDEIVRPEHSDLMERALRKAGKDVQLVKLGGDNHYLKEQESRMVMLEKSIQFINQNIGSPPH